jgi:hypothetical protein
MTKLEEDLAIALQELIDKVEDIRGVDIYVYAEREILKSAALLRLYEAKKLKRNARII